MTFRLLFEENARKRAENPLLYAHCAAMVGGWPKEVVDAVARWHATRIPDLVFEMNTGFPPGPTMRRAVAAFEISGVYNEKLADVATHYSRKSERYSDIPKRYRVDDPYDTYYYRTKAADILGAAGRLTHELGVWEWHRESTYLPTGEAVAEVCALIDIYALNPAVCSEVLQLRERGDGPGYKRLMDYDDIPEIITKRERIVTLNRASDKLVVYHGRGHRMPVRYHQSFCETWEQGGRLACSGTSFQSIHAHERLDLQIVDNATGERSPVVEYDFDNMHFVMLYKKAGIKPPQGDLYRIPGFDRKHCKLASVIMINATGESSGLLAVANEVGDEEFLALARNRGGFYSPKHQGNTYTHRLVDAVRKKHHKVAHLFFGDWGVKLQREESEMALEVMEEMIQDVGQPPLDIHDSFVAPEAHGHQLREIMREVARRHGLDLKVSKKKRRPEVSSEDLPDDHPLRSVPVEPLRLPKTPFINHTSTSTHTPYTPPTSVTYRHGEHIYIYAGESLRTNVCEKLRMDALKSVLRELEPILPAQDEDRGRGPPYG